MGWFGPQAGSCSCCGGDSCSINIAGSSVNWVIDGAYTSAKLIQACGTVVTEIALTGSSGSETYVSGCSYRLCITRSGSETCIDCGGCTPSICQEYRLDVVFANNDGDCGCTASNGSYFFDCNDRTVEAVATCGSLNATVRGSCFDVPLHPDYDPCLPCQFGIGTESWIVPPGGPYCSVVSWELYNITTGTDVLVDSFP